MCAPFHTLPYCTILLNMARVRFCFASQQHFKDFNVYYYKWLVHKWNNPFQLKQKIHNFRKKFNLNILVTGLLLMSSELFSFLCKPIKMWLQASQCWQTDGNQAYRTLHLQALKEASSQFSDVMVCFFLSPSTFFSVQWPFKDSWLKQRYRSSQHWLRLL